MKPAPAKTQTQACDWKDLTAWYSTPLGQHLLASERSLVDELLQRRFGYHLLQLGCSELVLHERSPMGHKFSFCPHADAETAHTAIASGEAIPLAADSVDLVLLHHALDYAEGQHQLLREVSRVLIAGGHVLIVGFNPWSCWGLRNRLDKRRAAPFNARPLSAARVTDWLALLDFQVVSLRYATYALPINSARWIRYSGWMEKPAARLNWPTGALYVLLARKQVLPLTPIHKQWRRLTVPAVGMPVSAERCEKPLRQLGDLPTGQRKD